VRRAGTAIDVDSLSTSEIDDSDIDSEGISLETNIRMPVSNRFLGFIVSGKQH
jgi:hypothetical protein